MKDENLKCRICQDTYTQRASLNYHRTNVHHDYPGDLSENSGMPEMSGILEMSVKVEETEFPDDKGKKMSKSLGNGLNPVGAIHNFSSDSLRLTLLGSMIPNRNIKMGGQIADRLLEKYRNFGNKLWNIAKFLEYQLQKHQAELEPKNPKTLSKASVWILKKFSSLDKSLDKNIQTYETGPAVVRKS